MGSAVRVKGVQTQTNSQCSDETTNAVRQYESAAILLVRVVSWEVRDIHRCSIRRTLEWIRMVIWMCEEIGKGQKERKPTVNLPG